MIQLSMHVGDKYCSNRHCRVRLTAYRTLQMGHHGHVFKICESCFLGMGDDYARYLTPSALAKPVDKKAARNTLKRIIRNV